MSLGRDGNKADQSNPKSDIDIPPVADLAPNHLPKKARPISDYSFPDKSLEDTQARKSAHLVNTAYKKKTKKPNKKYYVKYNENPDLEAASCAILHFLAPDNVPTASTATKNNQLVAVVTPEIPGFKSNRDDPLQEKDILIEVNEDHIVSQRNLLLAGINSLLLCTDRSQTGSFFNTSLQYSKNFINYYTNSAATAIKFREELIAFQKMDDKFSKDSIFLLKMKLQAREEHVLKKLNNTKQYANELELLRNAICIIDYLLEHSSSLTPKTIEKLERLDKMIKAKGTDINKKNENAVITVPAKVFGEEFQVTIRSLKNYRIVRGQAIGETARYIAKDPDGHNRNMSKYGHIIDFDMAKLNLTFRFQKRGLIDCFFRKPTKNSFVVTERDIHLFPDIIDADFFYWPTKQTSMTQSVVDSIPKIFENFFTQQDNQVYKKLTRNSVFIFHKFKTLLKYIVAYEQIYRNLVDLQLRKNVFFPDEENNKKNLFEEFITDEIARVNEIRQTLLSMEEFREFLSGQGDFAFSLIKDEIVEYRKYYEKKLVNKPDPDYQDLVDSLDIKLIENRYQEILLAAKVDKANKAEQEVPAAVVFRN